MRLTVLAVMLSMSMLSGCAFFRPKPALIPFPSSSATLMTPCPNLDTVPDGTTKLSELEKVVGENYRKYHSCANQVQGWTEWYNNEKKNYEAAQK